MTATDDLHLPEKTKDLGVSGYIKKPFRIEEVLQKKEKVLKRGNYPKGRATGPQNHPEKNVGNTSLFDSAVSCEYHGSSRDESFTGSSKLLLVWNTLSCIYWEIYSRQRAKT